MNFPDAIIQEEIFGDVAWFKASEHSGTAQYVSVYKSDIHHNWKKIPTEQSESQDYDSLFGGFKHMSFKEFEEWFVLENI